MPQPHRYCRLTLQGAPATTDDNIVPFIEGLVAIDEHLMMMVLDLGALSAGELPDALQSSAA